METVLIVVCVLLGAGGLWLLLRARKGPEVVGGDQKPAARRAAAPPPSAPGTTTLSPLDHHVRKLVADGNKIEAIKAVREHTGLGLKESKDYVDAIPNVVPLANLARPAAPQQPGGMMALFGDADLSEFADSPMVRRSVERAFEKGMSSQEIASMMAKLTGKSEAEAMVLVERLRPRQPPVM